MPKASPEPRDAAPVLAAIAGLFASAVFIAFVYVASGAPASAGSPRGPAAATAGVAPTVRAPGAAARPLAAASTARPTAIAASRATAAAKPAGTDPAPPAIAATAPRSVTTSAPLSATVSPTATTALTGTRTALGGRLLTPAPPYFAFRRPFGPRNAVEASRYYPYGTTGRGEYLLHHGVDIGNPMGAEVLAIGDGEVVYAGDDRQRHWGPQGDFYGNVVVIRHPETLDGAPLYSLYGHLSEVKAQAGAAVKAGDVIGLVGMTGIALGPHLHLELRAGEPPDYESTRNAELFLAPLAGRGTIVGRLTGADGRPLGGTRVTLFRAGGEGGYVAETSSYPGRHVNASGAFGENFLFADIPAGAYTLSAQAGGVRASQAVTVTDGAALLVELGG